VTHIARVTLWSWTQGKKGSFNFAFNVPELASKNLWEGNLAKTLTMNGCNSSADCVMALEVVDTQDKIVSTNTFFPGSPKDVKEMLNPNIRATFTDLGRSRVRITLRADAVAAYVWLDSSVDGRFDDNAFLLTPGADRQIIFEGWQDFSLKDFKRDFTTRSFYDIYYAK